MNNKLVRVLAGHRTGQRGTVVKEVGKDCWVDFNRKVLVNEGFGSMKYYPDACWVRKTNLELV